MHTKVLVSLSIATSALAQVYINPFRLPNAWKEHLIKNPPPSVCVGNYALFDRLAKYDDPKVPSTAEYRTKRDESARSSLTEGANKARRQLSSLFKGPFPSHGITIEDSLYYIEQNPLNNQFTVKVKGPTGEKELGDLQLFMTGDQTFAFATFSSDAKYVAASFKENGAHNGAWVLVSLEDFKVVVKGDWVRTPEIAITAGNQGVLHNVLVIPDNELESPVSLVHTYTKSGFTRSNDMASKTVLNEDGFFRLVPRVVGNVACVQAYATRGDHSSLFCGKIYSPGKCKKADTNGESKFRKISGDDNKAVATFSGSDGKFIVYYTSDIEFDLGAVYSYNLFNNSKKLLVKAKGNAPIHHAHVRDELNLVIVHADHTGSYLLASSSDETFEFTLKNCLAIQATLDKKGLVTYTETSYINPGTLFKWNPKDSYDYAPKPIVKSNTKLKISDFEYTSGIHENVRYSFIRRFSPYQTPDCFTSFVAGKGLAQLTLPTFSTTLSLILDQKNCNDLLIAHPRGSNGFGKAYRTSALGGDFSKHLDDIETIQAFGQKGTPSQNTRLSLIAPTTSLLFLRRRVCSRNGAPKSSAKNVRGADWWNPDGIPGDSYDSVPGYQNRNARSLHRRADDKPIVPIDYVKMTALRQTGLSSFDGDYFTYGPSLDTRNIVQFSPFNNLDLKKCSVYFNNLMLFNGVEGYWNNNNKFVNSYDITTLPTKGTSIGKNATFYIQPNAGNYRDSDASIFALSALDLFSKQ